MTEHASSHTQEELRTLKKSNRILKKKAVLHERENARFSKSLKQKAKELEQKDKELEQKDKELNLERSLWNSRKAGWDSGAGTDLHRIEVFDGIISDESSLHSATLQNIEESQYILRHVEAYVTASGETPLFCDDESRASDPGNRRKLRLRHALLMALVRKKDNPTQGTLQALFGVDQTSVCGYLKVMDRILAAVLPTAKNISKDIAACKTVEEFESVVPCISDSSHTHVEKCKTVEEFESIVSGLDGGDVFVDGTLITPSIPPSPVCGPDGGDVFVDGTHCHVQRPTEKTTRRMRFSGKKKQFTNNTNIYINADGVIIGMSKSFVGSTGDIMLLREDPMPFGRWAESMHDGSIPEKGRIRVWADKGYQGTGRDLPGITLMIPYKRSKNHRILTAEQKAHNHLVNSTRVLVEHSIGRIKRYARMTDPYDGTIGQFNREFNVITGLVNLRLLWDRIYKSPPSPDRWGASIDWNGTVPPAKGAPF